jgi:endoglucanase
MALKQKETIADSLKYTNTPKTKLSMKINVALLILASFAIQTYAQNRLQINDKGYFEMSGLNVTVFADFYPDGHQTGVTIIQHGKRVAANGDLRLEPSPGQWSPVPKGGPQSIDKQTETITQRLWYPDSSKNRTGFNPIIYPDFNFKYTVKVTALQGSSFRISVDLDEPLPSAWVGKVGFNFELFPGHLFGKSWWMDNKTGIFYQQPNGPVEITGGESLTTPFAKGEKLVVAPEDDLLKLTIETNSTELMLLDGRANHNNGWFIVRSLAPSGKTKDVVVWTITPNVVKSWKYQPVIQVSQVGYHVNQTKRAVFEQDSNDETTGEVTLYRILPDGREKVMSGIPGFWGKFLRYNYFTYDFSRISAPGLYQVGYREKVSPVFEISPSVFKRHVWQPVFDYFLPVQMCHMRINEKYRVWHGACHLDDALMAPVDTNHFDGYVQGTSTLTKFKPLQHVPQLNLGGWHDAGDYDLRIESQIATVWGLAQMVEEFGFNYDATLIDQKKRIVEIHQPDGKNDALQHIEHGLLSILNGYKMLGRLYRGIIENDIRQYVHLGDASTMTDNRIWDGKSKKADDRWVFTEVNADRELYTAAGLAAASRVLKTYNKFLADESLRVAKELYTSAFHKTKRSESKIVVLSELLLATKDPAYLSHLKSMKDDVVKDISNSGWAVGQVFHLIKDLDFRTAVTAAVEKYMASLKENSLTDSPYGVPYKPNIWGAGWTIQRFGVEQYYFWKGWPELGSPDFVLNALNFILGVHPGENNASFASGIGANSAIVAYGVNRADWSYIPGGVASGTALIRPDLPEFKVWPFFWQQTEYVMGDGATNFPFLVMAASRVLQGELSN